MLKEIFHESYKDLDITRIRMENQGKLDCMAKVVFLILMLPTFGARRNRYV